MNEEVGVRGARLGVRRRSWKHVGGTGGARGRGLPRGVVARAWPSRSPPDGWNPPWLPQPLYAPAVSGCAWVNARGGVRLVRSRVRGVGGGAAGEGSMI